MASAPPPGFKKKGGSVAPPPGFKKKGSGEPSGYSDMSTLGAIGTGADDTVRVMADTITRGYLDKLLGAEEQEKTRQSRERLSDWVEVPAEVGAAVISSPYRIGSTAAGGLFGAGEGALEAYGNQESWVPDPANIGKGALTGAVTGAVGAKGGEVLGGLLDRKAAKAAKTYKTDEELFEAAGKAKRNTKAGKDVARRGERVETARLAQTKGQKGFEEMLASIEKAGRKQSGYSRQEVEALSGLANRPNKKKGIISDIGETLQGGTSWGRLPVAMATGGIGSLLGHGVKSVANAMDEVNPNEVARFLALLRNGPDVLATGGADMGRDVLSKMLAQYGDTTRR